MMQAFLPHLKSRPNALVVNVSSGLAIFTWLDLQVCKLLQRCWSRLKETGEAGAEAQEYHDPKNRRYSASRKTLGVHGDVIVQDIDDDGCEKSQGQWDKSPCQQQTSTDDLHQEHQNHEV